MTFILEKSKRKNKKFDMVMPAPFFHRHSFGDNRYRDFTLVNDPNSKWFLNSKVERERVKKMYRARAGGGDIRNKHSPSALSFHILWSKPTLSEGIQEYERVFKVKVKNNTGIK